MKVFRKDSKSSRKKYDGNAPPQAFLCSFAKRVSTVLAAWFSLPAVSPTTAHCDIAFHRLSPPSTAFHRGTAVAIAAFLSELRTIVDLQTHPNIVRYYPRRILGKSKIIQSASMAI